jgi:hypothetical protein
MEKNDYENIKTIKAKIAKKEPTTFAERNIVNIYEKRMAKKKRDEQPKTEKGAYYFNKMAEKAAVRK